MKYGWRQTMSNDHMKRCINRFVQADMPAANITRLFNTIRDLNPAEPTAAAALNGAILKSTNFLVEGGIQDVARA